MKIRNDSLATNWKFKSKLLKLKNTNKKMKWKMQIYKKN